MANLNGFSKIEEGMTLKMKKFGTYLGLVGIVMSSHVWAAPACEPQNPLADLIPLKPCPGKDFILQDPKYCESCAAKEQSMKSKDAVNYPNQKLEVLIANALNENSFSVHYRGYVGSPEYLAFKENEGKALKEFQDAWKGVDEIKRKVKAGERVTKEESDRANEALKTKQAQLLRVRDEFKKKNDPVVNAWYQQYQKETLKKFQTAEVKTRLDALAREKYCANGVNVSWDRTVGITSNVYEGEGLPPNDLVQSHLSYHKEVYENNLTVCSDPIPMRSKLQQAAEVESLDVSAEDFFADNQTTLDPKKSANILKMLDSKLKPTGKKNCVKKIKSLQIMTSANQKANTGVWEQNGQKWDFLTLSKQRALTLQNLIGKHLVDSSKSGKFELAGDPLAEKGIASLDFWGEHGDGTSGKCPYRMEPVKDSKGLDSGVLKVSADDKVWSSPDMDEAKYAQIEVETEEVGPGCTQVEGAQFSEKELSYVGSKCFVPKIECR